MADTATQNAISGMTPEMMKLGQEQMEILDIESSGTNSPSLAVNLSSLASSFTDQQKGQMMANALGGTNVFENSKSTTTLANVTLTDSQVSQLGQITSTDNVESVINSYAQNQDPTKSIEFSDSQMSAMSDFTASFDDKQRGSLFLGSISGSSEYFAGTKLTDDQLSAIGSQISDEQTSSLFEQQIQSHADINLSKDAFLQSDGLQTSSDFQIPDGTGCSIPGVDASQLGSELQNSNNGQMMPNAPMMERQPQGMPPIQNISSPNGYGVSLSSENMASMLSALTKELGSDSSYSQNQAQSDMSNSMTEQREHTDMSLLNSSSQKQASNDFSMSV